jgi:uncharacterized peroxidase-related enzyme
MTRIAPIPREDVEEVLKDALERQQELLGLVPESLLTMAHRPRMAALFAELASECLEPGSLDRGLKQLVAYVASATTGCRYCQAHTAQSADMVGVEAVKIEAAFEYDTSGLFDDAERSALRLAHHAALVPNGATDEHFEALRQHYSDEQIAEIVGVIALFGWLNRWNDTMATSLESSPLSWARENLSPDAWDPGRHVPKTT